MSNDTKTHQTGQSIAAATDVQEFITDLDGGQFERALSVAISQVAAGCVDREKPGEVIVKLKVTPFKGTHQVTVDSELKFTRPTMQGKAIEFANSSTVLHVGKFGRLSLAQPSLLEDRQQKLA